MNMQGLREGEQDHADERVDNIYKLFPRILAFGSLLIQNARTVYHR